ncbi:MAG: hypothetical protein H8E31_14955 [Planctomycetes bacterium]|nr:hypothetical protein [Planctomycetota bacterium]
MIEPAAESGRLLFEQLPPAWVVGLVLAPLVILLAAWAYRRPQRGPRRLLATLRALLLALAVALAAGPFLRRSSVAEEPAPLALLVDDSASLQRHDALAPDALERLQRAGLGSDPQPQRITLVRELLASPWPTTLAERYQLGVWRFASRLAPAAADGSDLSAEGQGTALGAALLELLAEHRGRRLPDVVVLTDGRSNQGAGVEEAALRLAAEGVRVHAVALGDPRPAPDLSLERVQAPDVVLAGDEALFSLRLRATGEGLPEAARVRLLDESSEVLAMLDGVPLAGEAGVQFSLSAVLREPGLHTLRAVVDELPGEHARDNNVLDLLVEVKEVRIRVLYVDGRSRYEYRFLKNRLVRPDESTRDVEVRVWLADASRDFLQESSDPARRLQRVPTTAEELLEDFDVVIIGDVDPGEIGREPLDGARFLDAVASFVARGGGLLMLAGPRHNPSAYLGSPLEPLLPVVIGREPAADGQAFRPRPADLELPHPVVRLAPEPRRTAEAWAGSTPLLWYRPVESLKPGAQAWLVHDAASNRHGPMVIAAGLYVPEGRVGWIGTDETWRWRDPGGESQPQRFWRAVLRHLASGRLRGDQGRVRLDLDRTRIDLGETVSVEARLLDESYQPELREDGVDVYDERSGAAVRLAPVPDSPGLYRGALRPSSPGQFGLVLTDDGRADGEVLASARLTVLLPSAEMRITAQDRAALVRLTRLTGGRLVDIDRADVLLDQLDGREKLTRTLATHDLPLDGATAMSLFLLLAAAEWLLRKRSNLS